MFKHLNCECFIPFFNDMFFNVFEFYPEISGKQCNNNANVINLTFNSKTTISIAKLYENKPYLDRKKEIADKILKIKGYL